MKVTAEPPAVVTEVPIVNGIVPLAPRPRVNVPVSAAAVAKE